VSASWEIREGDALDRLREMDDASVHCVITSPPYFHLRDFGVEGQIGLEPTLDEYVAKLVEVFAEVKRVLRDDGTLWLNLGDSYAGSWGAQSRGATDSTSTLTVAPLHGRQIAAHPKGSKTGSIPAGAPFKAKDMLGVPWMTAFALRADGWYLRRDIIWSKPNAMPESVADRPGSAHEYVFLMSKSAAYYYDHVAVRQPDGGRGSGNGFDERLEHRLTQNGVGKKEPWLPGAGRNLRSVWTIPTRPYPVAHFATFPPKLIEPMVRAGCPPAGVVLDPFAGSGTTLQVAIANGRSAIGIELNPEYAELCRLRLAGVTPPLFDTLEPR